MINFVHALPFLYIGFVRGKLFLASLLICILFFFLSFFLLHGCVALGNDTQTPQTGISIATSSIALDVQESLVSNGRMRSLQSVCGQSESAVESLLSTLYMKSFNCDCSSGSSNYNLLCDSSEQICCGDICGIIHWTGSFSSDGTPKWEQSCISYSTRRSDLNGKIVCHKMYYSGMKISYCSSNVNGNICNSCEVCGNLPYPFQEIQYVVPDCSNIDGFDFMNLDCGDLDTYKELQDLSLTCASDVIGTSKSKMTTMVTLSFALTAMSMVASTMI